MSVISGLRLLPCMLAMVSVAAAHVNAAALISPWTLPKVHGAAVSCWGRSYKFERSVLPSAIVTQRRNILAAPVELAATIGGRRVRWSRARFESLGCDSESARYSTSASGAKLSVECKFSTEFDGATRVDLTVTPKALVKLDSLDIVIPLKTKYAALFHHHPTLPMYEWDWPKKHMNSGALTAAGLKLPFTYHIWLGNDDCGVQFFAESDERWSPANPESAVTVSSSGGVTTLWMNMLADYELSREWKWTFGFVATPVKPFPQDRYKIHYCQSGDYGLEKVPDGGGPSLLDLTVKRKGANYVGYHESWSDEQSLPRPKRPEDLRSLIKGCHELGMGLVLYTGLYMSSRSPEFDRSWRSTPMDQYFVYERPDNHDKCYYMCPNSGFPGLLLKTYDEAFKEYGMDGLYLDGLAASLPCNNAEHGCGYIGEDGAVHATMPIWKPRETMKRLWRMVKGRPKPGIIVGHTSASLTLPILSFVDIYVDGEHLTGQRRLGTEEYPEDILRAEMSGHNFGIPAIQLPISGTDAQRERARTLCLLYDAPMEWHPWDTVDIWRAFDSFGMDKVEWIPYWKAGDLVQCAERDVKVSGYLDKGRGALLVVANLGSDNASATLALKPSGLGLGSEARLRARDEVAGTDLTITGHKLTVEAPSGSFRLISVQRRAR